MMEQKLKKLAPLFQKYQSPISVATRMAQFVVESKAGESELFKKSNNGFGIKASAPWTGESIPHDSLEADGNYHTSYFRKYPSLEASIKDHAEFFTSTPYRAEVAYLASIMATDYKVEANGLTGIYAGDLKYGQKLIENIERYNLTQYNIKNAQASKLTLEQAFAKLGLPFKKQLLPLTKTYGRVNRKQGTVIHQTGAPQVGRNAQWMANYQQTMSSPTNHEEKSWNYQVDDQQAIMSFEHEVATWQSTDGRGPGNTAHVSIESCINADGNYTKGIDNLAKTMAVIAYIEDFKNIESTTGRHYDFARDKKWCPAQVMNGKDGFTYTKLKAMAQAHLNTLKGATFGTTPIVTANPQGLETSKIPAYTAPELPFKQFEVGDTLTIDKIWAWYDDSAKEFLHSKRHDELAETTFTIEEVKEIDPIGYSKIAYKSKEHNSWILEEDVSESRQDWQVEELDPTLGDEGKDAKPAQEGRFWLGDRWFQVLEVGD